MRTQVLFLTLALLAVLAQSSSNRHHHHHSRVQSKGTGSSLCSCPAKSRFFFSTSESRKGIASVWLTRSVGICLWFQGMEGEEEEGS